MITKIFTTSAILATILFSGCGTGVAQNDTAQQPHDTSKLGRTVSVEKDWTWDVSLEVKKLNSTTVMQTHFWEGLPKNLKKFQVFIDMDNDTNTGYSGSNGWEIDGADYLVENGKVYKSLSTTEWKWEYVDGFKDALLHTNGLDKYGFFDWRASTPTIDKIFNKDGFKVMIEAYDENWEGTCNTITGLSSTVVDFSDGDTSLSVIEESIRASYNTKFTTVTTIDFAPNKQEAIVMKINKWTGKKMYLINISDIEKSIPIAVEYKNMFIYKTNVVKDGGIVEFQVKEDDGLKYQVVYDYKNNKEISKTLIEGNPENVKKVLLSKAIDDGDDGIIENRITYKYDVEGKLIERNTKTTKTKFKYDAYGYMIEKKSFKYEKVYTSYFVNTYNNIGKLIKTKKLFGDLNNPENVEITEYDEYGNITLFDNDVGISKATYTYANDGRILQKQENNDADGYIALYTYIYDDNNRLSKINIDYSEDGVLQYSRVYKEFSYNPNDKVQVEKKYWGSANDVTTKTITFVYDDDGDLIHESTDFTSDGSIDKKVYNVYKRTLLPN